MNLLSLENVSVRYGDVAVIREVSLSVEEGAITCLVGSNGAGKSSLLQALSGIIACKKGRFISMERTSPPGRPISVSRWDWSRFPKAAMSFPT